MDAEKVGRLIFQLRKEKKMTQKQLADPMNISDKTISKWERGLGCPDISLLGQLSNILQVDIEKILSGDLSPSDIDGGNMKRMKFYVCPDCGNVITSMGEAYLSCCGRKISPLLPGAADEEHRVSVEDVEDEWYLTFPHEMTKSHFISFVALVMYDRMTLIKLYPEQEAALRIPKRKRADLYYYCNQHGLMKAKI